MAYDAETIGRAAEAVRRVRDIDSTLERIGQKADASLETWGKEVRDIFGRNLLSQMTHENLGDHVFCAVMNALLDLRSECVAQHNDVVDFPPPPYPKQIPQTQKDPASRSQRGQ